MQVSELFKQSNTILLDGGMGTMLFTASGMALLAMAGAVMVIPHSSRKKEER